MSDYWVDKETSEICQSCPRRTNKFLPATFARKKPGKKSLMFVGDSPSYSDIYDYAGEHWTSNGDLLRDLVKKQAGVDWEDIYLTNAVRCYSNTTKTDKDKVALTQCKQHLLREIDVVSPDYILAFGNSALLQVQNKRGIKKFRGIWEKQETTAKNCQTLATYHPAASMYNSETRAFIARDVKEFFKEAQGTKDKEKTPKNKYRVCNSLPKIQKALQYLSQADQIVFDCETSAYHWKKKESIGNALDYQSSHILCLSFAIKKREAFVIPFTRTKLSKYIIAKPIWSHGDLSLILKALKDFFETQGKRWVGHNIKFDMLALSVIGSGQNKFSCWLPGTYSKTNANLSAFNIQTWKLNIYDTMLGAHLLNENNEKGLKALCSLHTDIGDYAQEVKSKLREEGG